MTCSLVTKTLGRVSMAALVLAGAVFIGPARAESTAFGVPLSPHVHLYSYFIINGMARGAFLLGKLHPKDMPVLIKMDEITRKVLLCDLDSKTIRSAFKAEQILTRYLGLILK